MNAAASASGLPVADSICPPLWQKRPPSQGSVSCTRDARLSSPATVAIANPASAEPGRPPAALMRKHAAGGADRVECVGRALTDRLNRLVDEGVLERVPYSERARALRVPAHQQGPRT